MHSTATSQLITPISCKLRTGVASLSMYAQWHRHMQHSDSNRRMPAPSRCNVVHAVGTFQKSCAILLNESWDIHNTRLEEDLGVRVTTQYVHCNFQQFVIANWGRIQINQTGILKLAGSSTFSADWYNSRITAHMWVGEHQLPRSGELKSWCGQAMFSQNQTQSHHCKRVCSMDIPVLSPNCLHCSVLYTDCSCCS